MLRCAHAILQRPVCKVSHRSFLTLILGPPGGGKGTVCKKVVKDFGYNHVSTGDMLRAHVRDGTELGKKAKSFMDSGGLVPDELIINMLSAKLEELGADSRVLLDGFPRTRVQAEALNAKSKVDAVVCLKVKEEEIVRRISDRWIHPASGRTYSQMYSPPKVEGKDDETGEPLVQRDDDKPEAVWERLGQFNSMTTPVIEYYHEQGVLANISGDDAPDLVAKDRRSDAIYQALKPYLERAHAAS